MENSGETFEFFGGRGTIYRNTTPCRYLLVNNDKESFQKALGRIIDAGHRAISYSEINVICIRSKQPAAVLRDFKCFGLDIQRILTTSEFRELLKESVVHDTVHISNDSGDDIQKLIF